MVTDGQEQLRFFPSVSGYSSVSGCLTLLEQQAIAGEERSGKFDTEQPRQ